MSDNNVLKLSQPSTFPAAPSGGAGGRAAHLEPHSGTPDGDRMCPMRRSGST